MAISNNGETLVSAGMDGVIRLWDLQTPGQRRILRTMRGANNRLESVSFSAAGIIPDGLLLAAGDGNGCCHVWHIKKANDATTNKTRSKAYHHVDMKQVNRGKDNCSATAFSTTATYQHGLKGHRGSINTLAFRPDTLELATGDDKEVHIWHTGLGRCLFVLQEPSDRIICIAYNRRGTMLASGADDGCIHIWTIDDWGQYQLQQMLQVPGFSLFSVAISPDGKTLASSSTDRNLRLWDIERGDCLHVYPLPNYNSWSLNFDTTGERLMTGHVDGQIRIWSVVDRTLVMQADTLCHAPAAGIISVEFSPLGDLFVSGGHHPTVRIWDAKSGAKRYTLDTHTERIRDIAFWPNSHIFAAVGADGLVRLCDAASGSLLQTVKPPGPYEGMNITGVTGITEAQKAALKALGAIEV